MTMTPEQTVPTATERSVLAIVRDVLAQPALSLDDDMFDHGGTSLSFVRALAQINEQLHARIRAADLGGVATARNLARCAAAQPGARQTEGA